MKALHKQKEPVILKDLQSHSTSKLNEYNKYQVKNVVSNFVREQDKKACEHILNKLQEEKIET